MQVHQCLNCGKPIASHKLFCSNKGPRNCKDRLHNRNNPRGYQRVTVNETKQKVGLV